MTNDCKPCTNDISQAVLECILSFTPFGCPYDLAKATYQCGHTAWNNGLSSQTAKECAKGFVLPAAGCALELFPPAATAYNAIKCAYDIIHTACNGSGASNSPGSGSGSSGKPGLAVNTAKDGRQTVLRYDLGPLQRSIDRFEAVFAPYNYALGDPAWFSGVAGEETKFTDLMRAYRQAIEPGSDAGDRVSDHEKTALLAWPRPSQVDSNHVQRLCDRWNRTLDYYDAGIFLSTQVPFGENPDFLAFDVYLSKLAVADVAARADEAEGFTEIGASVEKAMQDLAAQIGGGSALSEKSPHEAGPKAGGGGVCATVVLKLDQDAVLTRDAFRATLDLINSSGTTLSNVTVSLSIGNAAGDMASGLFFIAEPELNHLSGVNGNGAVKDGLTGSAAWTLVPYPEAAPGQDPVPYVVRGRLSYTQEGFTVSIPLTSTPITVHPTPSLRVKYFHERDVFSDDPFTDEIEPAVPYSLGVFVQNFGRGTARNFRIISGEPQIVENEKGLLIDFDLIATEVAGQNLLPSLTAEFGNLDPGGIGIARWLFKSTLQGVFIDYEATFDHTTRLGGQRLSPIESVEIHELIHIVQGTQTLPDRLPDFLVNDLPDSDLDLPDTLYLSDGTTLPVSAITTALANASPTPDNLSVPLTALMPPGWSYLRVPVQVGAFTLMCVLRSDGAELPPDNFWITTRTFLAGGRRPLNETNLHLLDYDSTGSYTLTYSPPPGLDVTPPSSALAALPPVSYPQIPLSWAGSDGEQGSGLAFFEAYVSVNGGPFVLWLDHTTLTGTLYEGAHGQSYAFYTVATDLAGNRELPPGSPDAQTTVSLVNTAPILTLGADQSVNEGTLVGIANSASDADVPAQRLVFSLGPGTPAGVRIHALSGLLSWPTGEGTGPSTNRLAVIVHDSGFPSLSATGFVTVIVREVNTAPVLTPVALQRVSEGSLLSVTVGASDSDLPANQLTFRLGGTPPAGAAIASGTGVFQWKPSPLQGPSTNVIPVTVTDNGQPPLSATQHLTVIVRDVQGDFVVAMGSTNLLAGESSFVPIFLTSDDLAACSFNLTLPLDRVTDVTLVPQAPDLISAMLTLDPTLSQLNFQFNPATLVNGTREVARLSFRVSGGEPSATLPLDIEAILGRRTSGLLLTNGVGQNGRVIVVDAEPVLMGDRTDGPRVLLYGRPGATYELDYTRDLNDTPVWLHLATVPMSGRRAVVNLDPGLPAVFVRARQVSLR